MFPFFLALYNGSQVSIVALWATCYIILCVDAFMHILESPCDQSVGLDQCLADPFRGSPEQVLLKSQSRAITAGDFPFVVH